MGLYVNLMVTKPCEVYSDNITHNLGKMASAVILGNGKTLYDVLWKPDEHGYTKASDILPMLREGMDELISFPDKYKVYNPENGWGSYENFVQFVYQYRSACIMNPDADLEISR
jgi:hypothetical protein